MSGEPRTGVVNEARRTFKRDVKSHGESFHQAAVALDNAPVHAGVVIAPEVKDRKLIKLDAVDIRAGGIEQRIPAAAGIEQAVCRLIAFGRAGLVEALEQASERRTKIRLIGGANTHRLPLVWPPPARLFAFTARLRPQPP